MVGQRGSGPLIDAVLGLAHQAATAQDESLAQAGRRAVHRLTQPPWLAVVGNVSSGKSTLINALLESMVCPTDGGECTRVVYTFRHGPYTGAWARQRDGLPSVPVGFTGTRLATRLPIPAERIQNVDVTLAVPFLERAVLIDTPGLASTNQENSARAERLLTDTSGAALLADSLLFCMNGTPQEGDLDPVRAFQSSRAGARMTPGAATAVLTHADRLDANDRDESWRQARGLAKELSTRHADLFGGVVPVDGLLAQAALTGALHESHARALHRLATAYAESTVDIGLRDEQLFETIGGPVEPAVRRELVALLGLSGVGVLVDAIRTGLPAHAATLIGKAREASGFDQLSARLDVQLGERSDVLKSATVIEEIMSWARFTGDTRLHDRAQALLDRPEMFPVQLQRIAYLLAAGTLRLPDWLAEQVWIAVTTGLPIADPVAARQNAAAWRDWQIATDGTGRWVARLMIRAWELAATGGVPRDER